MSTSPTATHDSLMSDSESAPTVENVPSSSTTAGNNMHFLVELEDDPIKNSELGDFPFPYRGRVHKKISQKPKADPPALAHYESEPSSGRSYLSFEFTTIQALGEGKSLFVVRLHFHPAINTQFTNAIVKWEFLPLSTPTPDPRPAPRLILHAPRKVYGGITSEKRRVVWGVNLPLAIGIQPMNAGLGLTSEFETEREIEHSMIITGSARGSPFKNNVKWTMTENSLSGDGLPSEIQLAAVVEHHGPILCKISVRGAVGRGFFAFRRAQSKTGPLGEGVVIDVDAYRGLLREFEFGDTSGGWNRLLNDWTGQVDNVRVVVGKF